MNVKLVVVLSMSVLLSACAEVTSEKRETATIQEGYYGGFQYQIRTQTFQTANGPAERTSVIYRGITRPCIRDSPGDCEKAAAQLIEDIDESFFPI